MVSIESKTHWIVSLFLLSASLLAVSTSVAAEVALRGYLGGASTDDASVDLRLPGQTDLTFSGVSWSDESFTGPIYYGLGFVYWLQHRPRWGFGADFTHAKMVAELGDAVDVRGIRAGEPVTTREPLGDTFQGLSFTHGHNLLTLTATRRWLLGEGPGGQNSRWRPYLGIGLGAALPHVEVDTGGNETYEYQFVGPAAQGFVGAEVSLSRRLALFGEYKLGWADMEAGLTSGGTVQLRPRTHHLVAGISLRFQNNHGGTRSLIGHGRSRP